MEDRHVSEEPLLRRVGVRLSVLIGLLALTVAVSDLARAPLSTARLVAVSVGLAAFVAVYWLVMPTGRRPTGADRGWKLAGLASLPAIAIALLLAGAPASFTALFVYVVAAAGFLLQPWPAVTVTAATALGVGIGTAVTGSGSSAVAAWVLSIASIGAIMIGFGYILRANRELQEAREDLARLAVGEERLRIARDLHDLLGHSLSLIALKAELAARVISTDTERAAAELADVQSVTRRALVEVRAAVQGYRNLALDEALDGARLALSAAGIDYDLEGSDLAVPPEVEAVLAWAVREGTTNVIRHSHAGHCEIRVHADRDLAAVEVEDDGDVTSAMARAGSGLAGLGERARAVQGTLEAGPRDEGGFRLRVTIPLAGS